MQGDEVARAEGSGRLRAFGICDAAREHLLALCYSPESADVLEFLSVDPAADPALLEAVRRADFGRPEVDGRAVRYVVADGSAAVTIAFDAAGCVEGVRIDGVAEDPAPLRGASGAER